MVNMFTHLYSGVCAIDIHKKVSPLEKTELFPLLIPENETDANSAKKNELYKTEYNFQQ